jgi:hypothetical protein
MNSRAPISGLERPSRRSAERVQSSTNPPGHYRQRLEGAGRCRPSCSSQTGCLAGESLRAQDCPGSKRGGSRDPSLSEADRAGAPVAGSAGVGGGLATSRGGPGPRGVGGDLLQVARSLPGRRPGRAGRPELSAPSQPAAAVG